MTKASNILQNAQNQMKVLEIYGEELTYFESEEIDDALENKEGNYSEVHTVCIEISIGLFSHVLWRTCVSASCQGRNVNV